MATFVSFANANGVCASRGGGNGLNNTAMGYRALIDNTTGYQNAAFGFRALERNTTGRQNTAVGFCALRNNITGVCNTAIGAFALYNTNTSNNTGVGVKAGCSLTSGASNTLIGAYAGVSLTTGASNTAIGYFALGNGTIASTNTAVGGFALVGSNGNCNTGIGTGGGCGISSGVSNTIIGRDVPGPSTASNTVVVSRGSNVSNSNGHTLWGNAGVNFNWIQCVWSNVSDCRDKNCIQDLNQKLGLPFLRRLVPVSFNWDNRESYVQECGYEYGQKDGTLTSKKKAYGFEAQQMKQVLEELEVEFEALGYDPEKDAYRITYEEMIALLIKGIQETSTRLETLEALAA